MTSMTTRMMIATMMTNRFLYSFFVIETYAQSWNTTTERRGKTRIKLVEPNDRY